MHFKCTQNQKPEKEHTQTLGRVTRGQQENSYFLFSYHKFYVSTQQHAQRHFPRHTLSHVCFYFLITIHRGLPYVIQNALWRGRGGQNKFILSFFLREHDKLPYVFERGGGRGEGKKRAPRGRFECVPQLLSSVPGCSERRAIFFYRDRKHCSRGGARRNKITKRIKYNKLMDSGHSKERTKKR